jgi:hypothetical protein
VNEEINELDGLWGWLLLFTGFVIWQIIRVGILIVSTFLPLFRDGTWEALTQPDSPIYDPMWQHVLLFQLAGNIAMGAMAMITLALLVVRSSYAPKSAIGLLVGSFVIAAAYYVIAGQIPSLADRGTDYEGLAILFRSGIAMLVWVPYFLISKRVKATFVDRPFTEPSS